LYNFTLVWILLNCYQSSGQDSGQVDDTDSIWTMVNLQWNSENKLNLKKKDEIAAYLFSISPTFYEQILHKYSFAKKLQSQTVSRKKLSKTLSYKKLLLRCWWNWHLVFEVLTLLPNFLTFLGRLCPYLFAIIGLNVPGRFRY